MSRSYHETRRQLLEESRWDYSDGEERASRVGRLARQIQKKRRAKAEARQREHPHPAASLLAVSVTDSDYAHYPLSEHEIQEFVSRIPGYASGLAKVELTPGPQDRGTSEEQDRDPLTGRPGDLVFPGIYSGRVLGYYDPGKNIVRLHAYIYDRTTLKFVEAKETLLKLNFLSTLVHELAHHFDKLERTRGRWKLEPGEKAEIYAEGEEHRLIHQFVLPYLRERFAVEVSQLENWLEGVVGARLSLESIARDPRTTHKGGGSSVNFSAWDSLYELFEALEAETPILETRRDFAIDLHYGDHFELALEILNTVLAKKPEDLEAQLARCDILAKPQEALAPLLKILEEHPDEVEAWRVRGLIAYQLKDWECVLVATEKQGALKAKLGLHILADRARAQLELGLFEELFETSAQMRNWGSPFGQYRGAGYEALAYLRQGRLDDALATAEAGLLVDTRSCWREVLVGVRYEVLNRRGLPAEVDQWTFYYLESWYPEWCQSLKSFAGR